MGDVKLLFIQRANELASWLKLSGWIIKDPVIKGKVHYPFTIPGLAQHFDPNRQDDTADLILDNSEGEPEVELVHSDDPLFEEKAALMTNLPTEIMQLKAEIMQLKAGSNQQKPILDESIVSEIKSLFSQLLSPFVWENSPDKDGGNSRKDRPPGYG